MRRASTGISLSLVAIFALSSPAYLKGQQFGKNEKFEARAQLIVQADQSFKNVVVSQLTRQLREINGVIVVDNDPNFRLEVVILSSVDGYAISSIGGRMLSKAYVETTFKTLLKLSEVDTGLLALLLQGNQTVRHHMVQDVGRNKLREACEHVIADFDVNVIEEARKTDQAYRDGERKASGAPK